MYDSVILLGFHGVGKDTLANRLCEADPTYVNVKFSQYPKSVLAAALDVPVNWLEDKTYRSSPISKDHPDISPLTLLNLMYHGRKSLPAFSQKTIDSTLDSIPKSSIPVFTDVRNLLELGEVLSKFSATLIITLERSGIKASEGDENFGEIDEHIWLTDTFSDGSADEWFDKLKSKLQVSDKSKFKPVLVVFLRKPVHTFLEHYDPMSDLISECDSFLDEYKVSKSNLPALLKLIWNEAESLTVTDVKPKQYMVFDVANHERVLPLIRKKAILRVPSSQLYNFQHQVLFNQEEFSDEL
jgi:hypothetical protein